MPKALPIDKCRSRSAIAAPTSVFVFFILTSCGGESSSPTSSSTSAGGGVVATEIAHFADDRDLSIADIDISPNGALIAASGMLKMGNHPYEPPTVKVWNLKEQRLVQTLSIAYGADLFLTLDSIRFSPDGRLLAACHSKSKDSTVMRVWSTETWAIVKDIQDSAPGNCKSLGFTDDGAKLIRISIRPREQSAPSLIVYSTTSWDTVGGLQTGIFYLDSLALSPASNLAAVSGHAMNPKGYEGPTYIPTYGNPPVGNTRLLAVVDLSGPSIVNTIKVLESGRVAWSADGNSLALATAGLVTVFDTKTGQKRVSESIESSHMSCHFTRDGRYFMESDFHSRQAGLGIRIWDARHKVLRQEIPGNFPSFAVSRDSRYLSAISLDGIIVWRLNLK